jgi:hypothetical protein
MKNGGASLLRVATVLAILSVIHVADVDDSKRFVRRLYAWGSNSAGKKQRETNILQL